MNDHITHTTPSIAALFDQFKVCIILPTYNNAASLGDVIERSLQQTSHVIVVNDGSTDSTSSLLEKYPVQLVTYLPNHGKGYALRKGFEYAFNAGYDYALTIDTDGQHYPEDSLVFLQKLQEIPGAFLIGARNLNQTNVPGKSTFGNRFSNFWFRLETGIRLPDTQSGFRLYPIARMKGMHFFTNKYEFEIESMVRCAWKGIPVLPVPIQVYYPKQEERVTHFRPLKDFFRISVLNSILVIITFLFIKPRDLLIKPFQQKGFLKGLRHLLFDPTETPYTRAASVGFGIFMGIVPIWGFQLLIGIPLAILFRMNKALFILAANISIFPPIIWAASLACGKLLFKNPNWKIDFHNLQWNEVAQTGKEFFIGGTVLAIVSSIIAFMATYFILKWRAKHQTKASSEAGK